MSIAAQGDVLDVGIAEKQAEVSQLAVVAAHCCFFNLELSPVRELIYCVFS
jgi:hypothetical protein